MNLGLFAVALIEVVEICRGDFPASIRTAFRNQRESVPVGLIETAKVPGWPDVSRR
jgi:hypothetical protein